MLAGALLLAAVWMYILRYVPDNSQGLLRVSPNRYLLLHSFVPAAAGVMAFLLVFGLGGGWVLAGRMLAPLAQIAEAARAASHGSLSHRIRLPGRDDEFRALADVFDTMLGQLESHVAEQRRFAANASHELRTPLAISQALLDVARHDPAPDRTELVERLRTVNTRAIDLTEALLPLAERRGITLHVTGETTRTAGSAALMLRMTTNLVQNAVVHNLPADGTVTIRTDEHAGVGLGLAIVHSIVRAHDGTLDLAPRPTGGLLVTVRIPDAPRPPSEIREGRERRWKR
jgi:two-component system sensor histidine kinase VanS